MKKRISAFALALLLLLSATSCGKTDGIEDAPDTPDISYEEELVPIEDGEDVELPDAQAVTTGTINGLALEKLKSVGRTNISLCDGGLYYQEGDLYGVMSFDGEYDTGPKYAYCSEAGLYFKVAETLSDSYEVADVNRMGLINAKGEEIVPMEYAAINAEGYRFIRAVKATKKTKNEDDALIYMTDRLISLGAEEGDLLYEGEWQMYDAINRRALPGVKGTNNYYCSALGDFLEYVTDSEKQITINYKCEELPEDANADSTTGTYSVYDDNAVRTVYDLDGNELFKFDETVGDLKSISFSYNTNCMIKDPYFYVEEDSGKSYYVDYSGNKVSADFEGSVTYYDGFIKSSDGTKIYGLDGTVLAVAEGEFETVDVYDDITQLCKLEDSKTCRIIDKEGNLIFQKKLSDDVNVYDGTPYLRSDDGILYYSFKEGDFVYDTSDSASWLLEIKDADGNYDIVDPFTGNTVLEYIDGSISAITDINSGITYIYVENDNGTDIYKMIIE